MPDSNDSTAHDQAQRPVGMIASRPHSDRLALAGRVGQGITAYRSDLLQLWLVGTAPGSIETAAESLVDLDQGVSALSPGVVPPPGIPLPVEIQHWLTGLQFLREHLWSSDVCLGGMLTTGGRVWAVRAGLETELHQLTGAPVRAPWQEWPGGTPVYWCELPAGEVWRMTIPCPDGPRFAHYRPALVTVAPALEDDPETARWTAPPGPRLHAAPPLSYREGRQARRRRHRRAAVAATAVAPLALVPEPVAPEPVVPELIAPEQVEPETVVPETVVSETVMPEAVVPAPAISLEAIVPTFVEAIVAETPPLTLVRLPEIPSPRPHVSARVIAPPLAPVRSPAVRAPRPKPAPPRARRPAVPPILRHLAAVPRAAWIAGGTAAALVAVASTLFVAREPIHRLVAGQYTLELTTVPAGAVVRVDGTLKPGRTPMTLALEPGEHRVEATYGEYARAAITIDGERDDVLKRDFTWSGSLGIASADSTARLAVSFDGKPWGKLPLWKDDVPVGRHRLSFKGAGVRAWEEEVQIRSGQSTRVSAEPVRVPPFGLVTARAEIVTSDGVEDVDGAAVYLDGERAGGTPLDLKLTPGPHSIRIASASGAPSVHLIDVAAGGRYFASAQFGRPADPLVAFAAPERISLAAPPTLTIALAGEMPLPLRSITLYRRAEGGAFERIPVAVTNAQGRAQGVVVFPTTGLTAGRKVSYYVSLVTRDGEEYSSELRTIPVHP